MRATQDVDLPVEVEKADEIEVELGKLGYRCLHRSPDAANYACGDERLDFLYASRPIARGLLDTAIVLDDLMVVVEALCPVWPHRDPITTAGFMLL